MKKVASILLAFLLVAVPSFAWEGFGSSVSVPSITGDLTCTGAGVCTVTQAGGGTGNFTAGKFLTGGIQVAGVFNYQSGNPLASFNNPGVTEETLYTFSLPGGSIGASGTMHCRLYGDWINNIGATDTLTLKFKLGASVTTLGATAAVSSNATARPFFVDAWIYNKAVQNAQSVDAFEWFGATNVSGASNNAPSGFMSDISSSAVDTSTAQTVTLTGTLSTGTGGSGATLELFAGRCAPN